MMIEEPGEAAQRRRQVILIALTFLLFLTQGVALAAAGRVHTGAVRAVDVAQLAAPLLGVAGLLRGLLATPRYIGAAARAAAVDELTLDNRHRALALGFVAAVLACALLTVLAAFGRV